MLHHDAHQSSAVVSTYTKAFMPHSLVSTIILIVLTWWRKWY
jgi:hypothetical protein